MACRFYQTPRGCLRGDSCVYRHEKAGGSNDSGLNGGNTSGEQHGDGHGHGGYNHEDSEFMYSPENPYANGADPTRSSGVSLCHFYTSEAGCRNGVACPFAHLGGMVPPPPPPMMGFPQPPYGVQPMMYGGGMPEYASQAGPPLPPVMTSMHGLDVSSPTTPTSAPSTPSTIEKPRRKLDIQANPSKTANYEVISDEITPVFTRDIEGPFFAIDVECVATGPGVDDRDVARIAIVNEEEHVVFDQYVLPNKPIVSYLTQLTGITESNLVGAPSLAEALVHLRAILPKESVIVGQSIKKDLEWLGLDKGGDYKQMFDVADLFRIPMQSKNGTIRYRYFSLRHVAKHLLGHDIQEADHDPVIDAKYAMKIFKQFRHLHESPGHRDAVHQTLLKTPRTPSFADRFPVVDGVLMRVPRLPREPYRNMSSHHQAHVMPYPPAAPDPMMM